MKRKASLKSLVGSKPFGKNQKRRACLILVRGNKALHAVHERVRDKLRRLSRNPFKRYSFRRFRQEFFAIIHFHRIFGCPMLIHGVRVPEKMVQRIQKVKDLESRFVLAYSNMVRTLANRWVKRSQDNCYLEFDDFESEGYLGLSDAVFGYLNPKIQFSTYAYWAVRNRMGVAAYRAYNNFPWPRSLRKLYERYEQKFNEMKAKQQAAGFEEVVAELQFTDDQCDQLRAAMQQLISESSSPAHGEDDEVANDYTALAANRHHAPATLEPDQKQAIEDAGLNEWERAVLEGYLSGHYGWKTEVALRFGKSRMMPVHTLREIKKKVLRRLPEAA